VLGLPRLSSTAEPCLSAPFHNCVAGWVASLLDWSLRAPRGGADNLEPLMPGPAPTHRPTFTPDQLAACARLIRRPSAPQAQVARAQLARLLHAEPTLDHAAAARRLGKHPNWARKWRRTWATEGFRLADRPGRGRKPAFSPAAGGDGQGAGLRVTDAARPAAESV